ncbi:centrosomal protein of 192 kDa isoform X1 [Ahaetulla prasina]|uniref:centrosomal protein of 192 kDa isoform X1 n=2 Tax=Ahaetulla prasina TaxID=499056 RepID=UPI0026480B73|nr:centrosomal protein of 192 kDa isoform X1 [Ahaetulla prasina]XP_058032746.1 centrosomal protein of 192 kDa isoform X1 [Ahaetulla prasina]XP_058032747.1 centrosomal protein of 192 kDa isoform X1 [Ahaetulla prasina]
MEDFKHIGDETFPSVLVNSIANHTNEILGNITLSSNLGLPVAASTETRQKTGSQSRLSDHASYIERKFLATLASSCDGELDSDPRKNLMSNFHDTVENCDNAAEIILEPPQKFLQRRQSQNSTSDCLDKNPNSFHEKHLEDLTTKEYISLGKENENQFASLDPDQNDIASERASSSMAGFSRFIENEKLLSFESLEECSADYDIGDEEFCDDQLEAYFEQLVLPEIEDAEEHGDYIKSMELPPEQEKFQIPTVYQATVRNHSPIASYEESHDVKETHYSLQEEKFKSPTFTRQENNENCKSNPKSEYSKSSDKLSVGTAANLSEIKSRKTGSQHICSEIEDYHDYDREDGIFKITTDGRNNATNEITSELNLDSLYFKCIEDNAASEIWNTEQQIKFPNQCQMANENHISLADVYLSPTICKESEHDQHRMKEDQSHNIVYQNEEGKWVTDLAYYTSFDKEQKSNVSDISGDFITGAEAIAMIAQDQEEFEREHRFIQEEKMDVQNISGLEDISWKSVNNHNILRESQTDFNSQFNRDASYLRLSLGEFFGQKSEALGCLGGSGDVKRPSFGYHITSPKKRQPLPLLRQSDICSTNFGEQDLNISSDCQGDVKESIKKEVAFATSAVGESDMQSRENRTNQPRDRECERKHLQLEPSVLSVSTIASAIANASVSAEPSQLAALMMALSNKNKEGINVPEGDKLTDFSVVNQLLSSNIENSTFDIEKYLRRAEKVESNNEHEETTIDGHKFLSMHESKTSLLGDSSKNNFNTNHGKEKQHLEKIYEGNCVGGLHCSISSEQKTEVEYVQTSSNTVEYFPSKEQTSLQNSKEKPPENAGVSSETELPSIPTSSKSEERANTSTLPFDLKVIPVLVPPIPNNEKATNKENSTCYNEKHVTFENIHVDNQTIVGEAVGRTEPKLMTSTPGVQISDEQYSFRPSTSPLTHSSPSESSGGTFTGSVCPSTSPNFKESTCNDKTLQQSIYADPSLEHLTFVSATENTYKSLALSSPTRYKNNRTSELSTTIVWNSPSSLMETQTGKNVALQSNKSLSLNKNARDKSLVINENVDHSNQCDKKKSTGELSTTSKDQPTQNCKKNNELDQIDMPAVQQYYTNAVHGPGLQSPKKLSTYNDLGNCISLNQNRELFKSQNSASKLSSMSSGLPALLAGCSLKSTPFAQQYLGSLPSHANVVLPRYCPPVLSVPAGLIYSTIPVGHFQSSVTPGIAARSGTGMTGTTQRCNLTSNQNIFSGTLHTGQAPDAGGLRQREESMSFGFERVKVPEEVKFPNSCCVGLTSHAVLNIFNPSERWLQINICLLSIMLDGEKVDPLKHRCLLFKSKTVIGPCATEELKMLFLPCQAGVFQCVLNIASWPFSADPDIVVQAEALGSRVVVNAIAENPDIEVEAGRTNSLDFGDLPYGSWKALPLKLTNKTCARMPIRLVIHATAVAWRCFTFSKEPVNPSPSSAIPSYNISQLAAPSVISHVMNASCDTQDPDVLVVWVQFRAPSKCINSDSLGPADEYFARIDVEIDCTEPGNVLKSIPLSARSGTPRIYAPKGLQTLYMCAKIGSATKQQLPLKNAGNIKVNLKIMTVEPDNCISINPEDLILMPEEEQEVTIEFSPKNCKNSDSVVKIMVLPSGPEYKVTVKGDVSMEENKPLVQKCSNSEVPPILANKQLLIWGGVQIGRTVQQKLILRNDSSSTSQQLRLLIRGQDQDCFQLKVGEYVYNNCEIKIRPKHDYSICLTFTPYRLSCMFAKLEMKQLGVLSQLGIKFTIPLYGYGGKSNVRLEDVKKQANRYLLGLPDLAPGKTSHTTFSVQNTGCRAAYVKVLCFKNIYEKSVMDPNTMRILPEKFILKEGSKQRIAITYIPSEEIKNSSVLSTICLFYGDEILRQQCCRTIQHKPEQLQKILSPDNPVVNIKFDEEFPGEELVEEVYDLPQHINDLQYFLTNMRKITLSVVNDSASTVSATRPSSVHQVALERPDFPEKSAMTLDVLPVKGPHGCALSSKNDGLNENTLVSHETWTLQPEVLILTAPFQSGATVTKYTQITNNSNRSLKFELSWPAHCLTVTPQHGTIEPGSNISIHVSPNPSLADNKSIFPWSGLIYILCDGGQKLVKVQIWENITEKSSEKSSSTAKMGAQQQSELAVTHIQPCQKKQLTKLEVKNRTIFFPETKSGEHSEKYLEIENNGDENLKWFLTSFAPPYVKDVDESGDVYRATYAAFQCSYLSGTLEICGKEKIIVSFLPRDKGHYSQFWDLECHPLHEPHLTDKYRLQFCGMSILSSKQLKNKVSTSSLVKINIRDVSQRREYLSIFDHNIWKGVYAQEDVYTFPATKVGESSTLKISMKNYSMSSCQLNFRSPGEPFYIKHSHYNLRCHHYCNLPVQFKPRSSGIFKCLLVVETDKSGTLTIQLIGEGLAEK